MKVHVLQIPPEGLHLEGEEDREILELDQEGIRALAPVRYDVHAGLSGGGLFATGRLEADVELLCGSCLERFPYTVKVEDFAVQIPLAGPEMVDLTPHVREDIVLGLPPYPHCDWNGERTCKGPAIPIQTEAPAPEEEANAWEELDKLKFNKGK